MDINKSKVMNDNSDIFSSCKCGTKFHKFLRKVTMTLMAYLTQKEVTAGRSSKTKRKNKRFSFDTLCQPCTPKMVPVFPEPASLPVTPIFYMIEIWNILTFPYISPTAQLTNLKWAQLEHHKPNPDSGYLTAYKQIVSFLWERSNCHTRWKSEISDHFEIGILTTLRPANKPLYDISITWAIPISSDNILLCLQCTTYPRWYHSMSLWH